MSYTRPRCTRSESSRIAAVTLAAIVAGWSNPPRLHAGEEAKPTGQPGPKVTYDQDVKPIFREHCFTCHNQNQTKGGLALDSYRAVMTGGSSGEVLYANDLISSRLWLMVNREDQPFMPPNQDKLAAAKLDVIKRWIEGGLLENAGSKVAAGKKTQSLVLSATTGGARPANPAMPERLWKQPVVRAARAGAITALAASPWGPVVAVAGQRQIVLYHTDTCQLLGVLPFPEGLPYVLRFSRDGSLLLAGGGRGGQSGCAVLFDVKTGRRVAKVGDELDAVLAADINDNHTRVALGGPQRLVRVFSTETGELVHQIRKHTDWVYSVEFSPDGVLLATSDRANGLFVWEAETAREYLDLRGHNGPVCSVSWRPDSNLLASSSLDGTVKLWELNEGKAVKSWNAHGGGVMSVTYLPDGRLATTGRDSSAKLWSGEGALQKQFPPFPEMGLKVAVSHDGKRIVAGDWSGEVRVWEAADGKLVATLSPNPPTLDAAVQASQAALTSAQAAANKAPAELATAKGALDLAVADKASFDQAAAQLAANADQAQQQVAAAQAKAKQLAGERQALEDMAKQRAAAVKSLQEKLPGTKMEYDQAAAVLKQLETQLAAKSQESQQAQAAADAAQTAAADVLARRQAFREAYGR